MNTTTPIRSGPLARGLFTLLLACALDRASAQILVSDYFTNTIDSYDLTTGATIADDYIGGQTLPESIAVGGNTVYMLSLTMNRVGAYDAITGAVINANFITGLSSPNSLEVLGNVLYVGQVGSGGVVSTYNATTGALLNPSLIFGLSNGVADMQIAGGFLYLVAGTGFGATAIGKYDAVTGLEIADDFITGLNASWGLAVKDNILYISSTQDDNVGSFNATTGAVINANIITGLNGPRDVEVSGNDLYVVDELNVRVGKYNATTGAVIDADFITGDLVSPIGIAIVPEPGSAALLLLGGLGLLARRRG